jgi:hypothetical protein
MVRSTSDVATQVRRRTWRLFNARAPECVLHGPPMLLMRILVAPVLDAATIGVLGTGVALIASGHGGLVLGLHKASVIVWVGAFAVHVLAYVACVPGLVAADWGRGRRASGTALRYGLLALALVLGVALAIAMLPKAGPWLHPAGDG